jgi:hypothetical protein
MSKHETIIQYVKIILGIICIGMLFYFLQDKTILLICK